LSPIRSSTWIPQSLLVLMLFGAAGGCDNPSGSIDVQKAPPVGLENETRPLKPVPSKLR
jgi:hypothetical protein